MLGHKMLQRLARDHDTWGGLRDDANSLPEIPGVRPSRLIGGLSADDPIALKGVIDDVAPDVVINCVGIVKQLAAAKDAERSIAINALLPHQLARLCAERGSRLIHFSTDCVFSGRDGPYREADVPDPTDLYGRSKLLGEVAYAHCFTIRSSIVGRSLRNGTGLFDWFFRQRGGCVKGFRRALYSGLTTGAMADVVKLVLEQHPSLSGVWHIAGDPIDKYNLLRLVNEVCGLGIQIEPEDAFQCDRRLDSSRFHEATGWSPPAWQDMIETMHADPLL
jgi:dTDP-4-dehydrorhamnose reductase